MPEVSVDIEVYCKCGAGLCNQTESTNTKTRQVPCFIVDPCEKCLEEARDEVRRRMYDEEHVEGLESRIRELEEIHEHV